MVVGGFLVWLIATAVSVQATRPERIGSLFGRPVTRADLLEAMKAVTHEAILAHGDRYREHLPPERQEGLAWERLMLIREVERRNIRVSDQELVQELQALPLFQGRDGRFDREGYQAVVQYSLGTTPRAFEEEFRDGLRIRRMLKEAASTPEAYLAWYQDLLQRAGLKSTQQSEK